MTWRAVGSPVGRALGRIATVVALLCLVGCAAVVGEADRRVDRSEIRHGVDGVRKRMRTMRRTLWRPAQRSGTLDPMDQSIVHYLASCTSPASRVLALTFAPELLFYSGRGFAAGQVALTQGYFSSWKHESLMLERLAGEDVPLAIMDSETAHEVRAAYPRLAALLAGRYREIARFPAGVGKEFILLGENDRPVHGRFGTRQLPCFAPADR